VIWNVNTVAKMMQQKEFKSKENGEDNELLDN
jgi:hypothetical protein